MPPFSLHDFAIVAAVAAFFSLWSAIEACMPCPESNDESAEQSLSGKLTFAGVIWFFSFSAVLGAVLFFAIGCRSVEAALLNESVPLLSRHKSSILISGLAAFGQGLFALFLGSMLGSVAWFCNFHLFGKIRLALLIVFALVLSHI